MPDSPTAPRYQLAQELKRLRDRNRMTARQVAQALHVSPDTIRRIERGETTVRWTDLDVLLRLYRVENPNDRAILEELRDQSDQPVWWSRFRLPEYVTRLLGFESAAKSIRLYELVWVPGLLQTEGYARALITSVDPPDLSPEQLDTQVRLRMERQSRVLRSDVPPELHVVVDEEVLRRQVGTPEVFREQLRYLLEGPYPFELRVLPRSVGAHPGLWGPYCLFEFGPKIRPPAIYVDGPVRSLYTDDAEAVEQGAARYRQMQDLALSPADSRELINTVIKELEA